MPLKEASVVPLYRLGRGDDRQGHVRMGKVRVDSARWCADPVPSPSRWSRRLPAVVSLCELSLM
jgi:hypothetical protein